MFLGRVYTKRTLDKCLKNENLYTPNYQIQLHDPKIKQVANCIIISIIKSPEHPNRQSYNYNFDLAVE